ncbi:hypothetical protein D3C71_817610 [compost metagenome]
MAACTINRPTTNDSTPRASRFRWKLSVRRVRLFSSPARLSCNWPLNGSGNGAVKSFGNSSRDSCCGNPRICWAKPMSTSSTPGAISACTCSGGRATPARFSGRSPSRKPSACKVCDDIQVLPGGLKKPTTCSIAKACPATAAPAGSDTGSMPINCKRCSSCPLSVTRPCSTGDTGHPARRRSINHCWGNVPPPGAPRLA